LEKSDIGWIVSFLYIGYIFIGQIPQLKGNAFFSTTAVSMLLLIAYLLTSLLLWKVKKTVIFFIVAALGGSFFEFLGLKTGIPFGHYYYTKFLGPLIGPIPLFIPVLWASLSFYAYQVGKKFAMPFLMVALDLSFDPRFSGVLWVWTSKTQYFGDPWTNFAGWFITAAVISIVFSLIYSKSDSIDYRAVIFYALFGYNNCISDLYAGLGTPALISFIIFSGILIIFLVLIKTGIISATRDSDKKNSPS